MALRIWLGAVVVVVISPPPRTESVLP
jgi:hypothetical protein